MNDFPKISDLDQIKNKIEGSQVEILLNCEKMKDKNSCFNELAEKFRFPDYFGYNWDAVDECLADLEWFEEKNIIVIFKNFNQLLVDEEEKQKKICLDIFKSLLIDTVWVEKRFFIFCDK